MARTKLAEVVAIGGQVPTNGAESSVEFSEPYSVEVTIQGTAPLLFHRWNVEAVAEKAAAKKGSKAKKTDDIASYLYLTEAGEIALPGEYVRQSVIHAAKYRQDPRSPRKSAMDLFKAGIIVQTELASLGVKQYDYIDQRRVVVQRNAITRCRPAMLAGWRATLRLGVLLPEYIAPEMLNEVIGQAGRLVGVGDFRPTYGRFQVTNFAEVLAD